MTNALFNSRNAKKYCWNECVTLLSLFCFLFIFVCKHVLQYTGPTIIKIQCALTYNPRKKILESLLSQTYKESTVIINPPKIGWLETGEDLDR